MIDFDTIHLVNASYLPSKKVLILVGVILLVAVGFLLFSGDEENPSVITQINDRIGGSDIDNSDYIGFRDETVNNEEGSRFSSNKTAEAWEDLLPYMASYVSVEGDKEISQDELDRLTEEIAAGLEREDLDLYSESDVSINTNASFEDLDSYFANMIQTVDRYYKNSEIENELLIFAEASGDGEPTADELESLLTIADEYESLAGELIQLSVPQSLVDIHLLMVNNYLQLGNATQNMSAIQQDPVRSMVGLQDYQELMDEQIDINEQLGEEIGQQARILLESQ